MNKQTEKALVELTQVCKFCGNHKLNPDSYTAPAFIEFLNSRLTIEQIPMESWNIEHIRTINEDPTIIPWEDSIKNFVFDLTSINQTKKFSSCIILSEYGYIYSIATMDLLARKHSEDGAGIIYITPENEECNTFRMIIRCDNKIELDKSILAQYLVEELFIWYIPNNTVVFCHESYILQYRNFLNMIPDSTWSIRCTPTMFIESSDKLIDCEYICPVYSHPASKETRAVGTGSISFVDNKITTRYCGRLNYYLRCIRGSRHSSGRCYDCQILYSVVKSVTLYKNVIKNKPNISFDSKFLSYVKEKSQQ